MYTDDMKFAETHEWAKLNKEDNTAVIGVSEHAQELLGDLVYIELPKVGDQVTAGSTMGVIESVKAASDLYAPLSGEVVAMNEEVVNDPTIVNNDAHDKGWLIKIKLNDASEMDKLATLDQYKSSINN